MKWRGKRQYFQCSKCFKVFRRRINGEKHICRKHPMTTAYLEEGYTELVDLEYGNHVIVKHDNS